uniref:Major facilitator superfamily (MFS) profile domain-containing protein n=1 Tax=Oryza punctata TaxID=4537 RepID=A0A0E0KRB8_ORYPU
MPGGSLLNSGGMADYGGGGGGGGLTFPVVVTCLMAASGGLIFGYDIGISGGVSEMESFLEKFFPGLLKGTAHASKDVYCIYNSQALTAFTSSLYAFGMVGTLVASRVTRRIGRQAVMLIGGSMFLVGALVNAAAVNIAMLIIGRMLLGLGLGFSGQATPVYLAEMSPPRWRGGFISGFPLFISVGYLIANLINYGTSRIPVWGWRLSLGLAAFPAAVMVAGAAFIPDTPSSLVLRGKHDLARAALQRVRGKGVDVDAEFNDILTAVEHDRRNDEGAFRRILRREYRPYLVMAIAFPVFLNLTGVAVTAFFSPILFRTVGFESDAALMGAVILGLMNIFGIVGSGFAMDRYGRRLLFMIGGALMFTCQVAMASIVGSQLGHGSKMAKGYAVTVLVMTCAFSASFSWSWGALYWAIPGEIYPVEVRSAGQGVAVALNLGLNFVQAQCFLAMLCCFKYGTFLFYASWLVVMTAFAVAFVPETKGVPLESMGHVFARHWYWGRFVKDHKFGDVST